MLALVYVSSLVLLFSPLSSAIDKEIIFHKCYDNVIKTHNIMQFETCVKKITSKSSLVSELIPVEGNQVVEKFSCCFNNLTKKLVETDNLFIPAFRKITRTSSESERMIACAILGDKFSASGDMEISFKQKFQWLTLLPSVIKNDIIQHNHCRGAANDSALKSCCANKYHDKMEILLAANCVHKAMVCRMNKSPDASCKQSLEQCVGKNHCNLGERGPSYRTVHARVVNECLQQRTTFEHQLLCILDYKIHTLPRSSFRYLYCFETYGHTNKAKFFRCLSSTHATKQPTINQQCKPKIKAVPGG